MLLLVANAVMRAWIAKLFTARGSAGQSLVYFAGVRADGGCPDGGSRLQDTVGHWAWLGADGEVVLLAGPVLAAGVVPGDRVLPTPGGPQQTPM